MLWRICILWTISILLTFLLIGWWDALLKAPVIATCTKRFQKTSIRKSYWRISNFHGLLSAHFLLIEGYGKCALRKEPVIAYFVGRFKAATLRKCNLSISLILTVTYLSLHFYSSLLVEDYERGALRKELIITHLIERF